MNSSLVERLREILLNLRVPPLNYSTTTLPPSPSLLAPQNDTTKYAFGQTDFYPQDGRESSSVVYGTREDYSKGRDPLLKQLQDLIQVIKMSTFATEGESGIKNKGEREGSGDVELNLTLVDITDLNNLMGNYGNEWPLRHVAIIMVYMMIAFVALVGNLLVVQLVIRSRRLHTLTHALLANLAVADLFMSTLNIPFSAARVILAEWPFGSFLCHVVPFVQVTSVYVTSITMAVIAVDRYQVIMNPLGRRMKRSQGIFLVFIIWSISGLLSLPYAFNHKVVTVLTVRVVKRCQAEFTSSLERRWLTVATFFGQYFIPLAFTTWSYVSIMIRLGLRGSAMGSTTPRQDAARSKAKRKTIKMLVLTVVFFAVCWAPINAYHLLTHFGLVAHNSTAILICHLIAMSSTCYNPFIYCWLNEHFRREALKWLCCCFRSTIHRSAPPLPGLDTNGAFKRSVVEHCREPVHSNHSGVSIPLFNLRPDSPASCHSQHQPEQQRRKRRIQAKGSVHKGITVELSSSSTSSLALMNMRQGSRRDREVARRLNSANNVPSSDECECFNQHQRLGSDGSFGINNSTSSVDNFHDSGCGTAKAESPV